MDTLGLVPLLLHEDLPHGVHLDLCLVSLTSHNQNPLLNWSEPCQELKKAAAISGGDCPLLVLSECGNAEILFKEASGIVFLGSFHPNHPLHLSHRSLSRRLKLQLGAPSQLLHRADGSFLRAHGAAVQQGHVDHGAKRESPSLFLFGEEEENGGLQDQDHLKANEG